MSDQSSQQVSPAVILLELGRRARHAASAVELEFIVINETHALTPYQLAALWVESEGVLAQSGVSQIEVNSPFILWLSTVCDELSKQNSPCIVTPSMLTQPQAEQWQESLPAAALWVPFAAGKNKRGGVLLCREFEWTENESGLITEWIDIWQHSWKKFQVQNLQTNISKFVQSIAKHSPSFEDTGTFFSDLARGIKYLFRYLFFNPRAWWYLISSPFRVGFWRNKTRRYALLLVAIALCPVKLSVLAPGELVPLDPAVIRVPIEGVVEEFFVTPNEIVKEGQLLFKLDLTALTSKLQVAQQEMQVASAEYRQSALQSLTDPKSRGMLAAQEGKATERQLEADYLKKLLAKAQITTPIGGIAIFDDPSTWIGKPVVAGEKVMVIATPDRVEIEVWVPLSDAIELANNSEVTLYLNTSPLSPVKGELRYMSHEAVARPDGSYAYRLRASIAPTAHSARIGLRGTARLSGKYVPLAFWVFRKPLAVFRQFVGI